MVGYYALAVGSVMAAEAPGKIKRNMPNPIPVIVLGHLTIDQAWQGQGIGSALMVHAIDDAAARFYEHHGFMRAPIDPDTLMTTLMNAQLAIS